MDGLLASLQATMRLLILRGKLSHSFSFKWHAVSSFLFGVFFGHISTYILILLQTTTSVCKSCWAFRLLILHLGGNAAGITAPLYFLELQILRNWTKGKQIMSPQEDSNKEKSLENKKIEKLKSICLL
ncbi:uncharacterized protein [Typha angustifolia]|uniref:uncharacterized protein isoform X3 n=1 Tax=Typha angustifolia TaxID=59011 RepID=UPI003C305CBC